MKSFLVIGMGRFGRHLTRYLLELGNEVMVLDKDEEKVSKVASTTLFRSPGTSAPRTKLIFPRRGVFWTRSITALPR